MSNPAAMNLGDASILVVEDEPILLELSTEWLAGCGFGRVFAAANGEVALALVQSESINLLVSDIRMPVMDGISLIRRLGEMGKSLPSIIFDSGFGDIDRREMYALGVEAFIAKPIDRKKLLTVLQHAVAERSTLWCAAMAVAPRRTLLIEANRMDEFASPDTIGLGRGGFSVFTPEPLVSGTVALQLRLAEPAIEIVGEGYIRWRSRAESKVGIELAFLDPACRNWLTDAIDSASPRSFIPGT